MRPTSARAISTKSTATSSTPRRREQASRCSQCGVPFCQTHCPLHNNIPDWLRMTAEGRLEEAYELPPGHQRHARDLRPHLPAGPAVRRQLRHRAVGPRHRDHRRRRALPDRQGLGDGLGPAARRRRATATSRWGSSAPGPRAWPPPSGCASRATRSPSTTATTARRPADLRHPRLQAGEGRGGAPHAAAWPRAGSSSCWTSRSAATPPSTELRGKHDSSPDRHRRLRGARR